MEWPQLARFPFALTLALLGATALASAQGARTETLELTTGRVVTGAVSLEGDSLVLERKVGKGSVKETYAFERVAPNSLYGVVVSLLSPLDRDDHRRVGDLASRAGLHATAARHYRACVLDPEHPTREVFDLIDASERKDFERMLAASRADLDEEDFRAARRKALAALRRYSERPEAESVPALLEEISRRFEAAKRRRVALERSRKAKEEWERVEGEIDDVAAWVEKARREESRGLAQDGSLRRSKTRYDASIRYVASGERDLARLRRNRSFPDELTARIEALEDEILAMHIRLRLHIASLYTIRGSFGSAIGFVNAALSFDPTDESALAARARVEQAAAAASAGRFTR
ncbi:MAG: hypothetical protein R3F20_12085 [Planctomycetota bacterium]